MITQIRMKNCQSWEDASFRLATDKLNVIEAPNSVGKSVFFKMLKITACPKYYDRVEREELIRWGTQCAMIIYQFDSGGAGAVKVYKEQPVYFYKPAGASGWEQSTEPSSSMLKEAGLLVDQENNFIANIIDTDQELLLVNPNLSSNYSLVKMLVYNGDLEKLKERIAILTPVFRDYEAAVFNKVDFYTKQVAATKFQDVVGLEDSLRVLRTATDLMFKLIDVYNSLQSIRDSVQFYRDYEFLFSAVDLVCSLEKICFADLVVMNEPVSVDFAALLQRLESIRLSDIVPRRKPVDARLLDLLETLMDADNALLTLKGRNRLPGVQIVSLLEQAAAMRSALAVMKQSGTEVAQCVEALEKASDVLECPVYGKVVYDGKKCLPCSF